MADRVLEIVKVTKHYGEQLILGEVSFSVNDGDRTALVGENGVGKSTLAKVIMGQVQPDSGSVRLAPGVDVGYLPQEVTVEDEVTVHRYLQRAVGDMDGIVARMKSLEADMSEDSTGGLLEEYGRLQAEFESRGGYELDSRIDRVLDGLGLGHVDRYRSLRTLSGGEKTRLTLAGLLLLSPGLLILDEPTNHLDFPALEWLEEYLASYGGAVLVISHDRQFLNKTVGRIIELSFVDHKINVYHGDYDFYAGEKERQVEEQVRAFEEWREEVKHLRSTIRGKTFSSGGGRKPSDRDKMAYDYRGGRVDKSESRTIQAARRRLEELEENPVPRPTRRWRINPELNPAELVSRQVIRFMDASKGYGGRQLFAGVSETIQSGARVVIIGPNGSGKSTLLKMVMGLVEPDGGEVIIAPGAKLAYLDQEQESLDPARTVLEEYRRGVVGLEEELRADLHRFGSFTGDQVFRRIGDLSVGQRRKLQIAKLVASKANVLVLDEPTNHLDLVSLEQFETALCEFGGTILAVSHDRWLINRLATHVWHLRDGSIETTRRWDVPAA